MDWAGYLAKNHGNTLYVAREEHLGATLQKKIVEKQVGHRCMDVSSYLPDDLSKYEYIFLDSVNRLGLTPAALDELVTKNRGKNFIEVVQTTKQGKSRGSQEHLHDVDIIIEVPERGKAVQYGRFNQGGEMDIFDQTEPLCKEGDFPMAA